VFSPVHLVGAAIAHFRACGASATLICPETPWASWWALARPRLGPGRHPRRPAGAPLRGPQDLGQGSPVVWQRTRNRDPFRPQLTSCPSTKHDAARQRELLRERVAHRRAGQPRRLKTLDAAARRLMAIALQMRASPAGQGVGPSEAVLALATRGKAPTSWNRYSSMHGGSLGRWEVYAARMGTPFLLADPTQSDALRKQFPGGGGAGRGRTDTDQATVLCHQRPQPGRRPLST
jgi:hypothetical protein